MKIDRYPTPRELAVVSLAAGALLLTSCTGEDKDSHDFKNDTVPSDATLFYPESEESAELDEAQGKLRNAVNTVGQQILQDIIDADSLSKPYDGVFVGNKDALRVSDPATADIPFLSVEYTDDREIVLSTKLIGNEESHPYILPKYEAIELTFKAAELKNRLDWNVERGQQLTTEDFRAVMQGEDEGTPIYIKAELTEPGIEDTTVSMNDDSELIYEYLPPVNNMDPDAEIEPHVVTEDDTSKILRLATDLQFTESNIRKNLN